MARIYSYFPPLPPRPVVGVGICGTPWTGQEISFVLPVPPQTEQGRLSFSAVPRQLGQVRQVHSFCVISDSLLSQKTGLVSC